LAAAREVLEQMEDTFDTMQLDTPEDAMTILERLNGDENYAGETANSEGEAGDEGAEEDGADDSNSRDGEAEEPEEEDESEEVHDRSQEGAEQQQQQQHPESERGTIIPTVIDDAKAYSTEWKQKKRIHNHYHHTQRKRSKSTHAVGNFALSMRNFDWDSRRGMRLSCQKQYGRRWLLLHSDEPDCYLSFSKHRRTNILNTSPMADCFSQLQDEYLIL
jgi:hypothetical protein